jgi:Zn-dependent protease/predicted transcriptional regulator
MHTHGKGDAMNDTFKLGRIVGIPIGLNWTWLLVFGLFVWSLASGVFPSTNPGLATDTYVEMAVAAVLLFFGSLLLHELGHAVQARRDGVKIEGITLWLFGGVARFRGMFPSAGAEFRIAIAGPVVTGVLAAAFVTLAALTRFHPAVDAVFAWLGYINLLLLGFNLLPALPLDGGRVFRAALWQIRGDFAWATRIAASLGRVIGGLMIAGGVIALFTQGGFAGMWLALIGWFVLVSAGAEGRLGALRNALDGLAVADLMRVHPIAAEADQTLRDFTAELPSDDNSPAYPVLDGLRPVGILPSARISQTPSDGWATTRVRDVMQPLSAVPLLTPDESAFDGMLALVGTGTDSALVLETGRLVGILSTRDVADALESRTQHAWARRSRRSDSRSPAVPVSPRPVTVPGHQTAPPREAA